MEKCEVCKKLKNGTHVSRKTDLVTCRACYKETEAKKEKCYQCGNVDFVAKRNRLGAICSSCNGKAYRKRKRQEARRRSR